MSEKTDNWTSAKDIGMENGTGRANSTRIGWTSNNESKIPRAGLLEQLFQRFFGHKGTTMTRRQMEQKRPSPCTHIDKLMDADSDAVRTMWLPKHFVLWATRGCLLYLNASISFGTGSRIVFNAASAFCMLAAPIQLNRNSNVSRILFVIAHSVCLSGEFGRATIQINYSPFLSLPTRSHAPCHKKLHEVSAPPASALLHLLCAHNRGS